MKPPSTEPAAPEAGQASAQSRAARQARLVSLLGSRAPRPEAAARALTTVSDTALDGWLASLERYQSACGCKSGAALGLLALTVWPAVARRRRPVSTVPEAAAGLGLWAAAGVIGALAGKLAGLAVAGAARRSLIRLITANLADKPPGTAEPPSGS